MNRTEILEGAQRIITGERQDQYGNPEDSFGMIARLWSEYLDIIIKPSDVPSMMILSKVALQRNQHKDDNLKDICGYAALAAELSMCSEDDDCVDIGEAYEEALKREKILIGMLEQYKNPGERLGDFER